MTHPPMPIVVGVPRSGTTMLRFMLDSHSQLAIPPETGFLLDPALADGTAAAVAERLVRFPADAPAWSDFGLDASSFLAAAGRLPDDARVADVLRLFYGLYAGRHAKPRFGDKTPGYLSMMPRIAQILPEARFVHVIRDGRDVALSWRERWFAPSRDVVELVRTWRNLIEDARADAGGVSYLEVRYSDLVLNADSELRRVCAFLELSFEPSMLRFHERAAERLQEHGARLRADGTTVVSRADRQDQQRRTTSPPDATRIGRWRQELTPEEIADCDRVAGELLRSVTG